MSPTKLILSGFFCLLVGWIFLFLIVIDVMTPNFAMAFGAYALSFAGMLIGLIGLFEYRRFGK